MTQKTNAEKLESEFEDDFLSDQIKKLDSEIQITLKDAKYFLNFILHYDNKLTQLESRLLEIRLIIESGQFNRHLEVELSTLIKRLQKLVDPRLKQKMINRLEMIKNFQDYASKKEEQLEWQIIRSRLDDFKSILQ